ncbi:hypothetical protein QR680_000490 [Steinernema hermaphroditum]|uniref:Activin types I and II receptor domain-containing protein n=1 Tax=Steinernema hermaphroditum TaxID=289476 RepID=A0AA39GXK2_9BILA|nr:hypothetical protein QR680_000490 [Steinernema hermaphroditum]
MKPRTLVTLFIVVIAIAHAANFKRLTKDDLWKLLISGGEEDAVFCRRGDSNTQFFETVQCRSSEASCYNYWKGDRVIYGGCWDGSEECHETACISSTKDELRFCCCKRSFCNEMILEF